MNSGPSVIVNKAGFLSSLARGLFGTIIAVVICASAVGIYGMRLVDRNVDVLRAAITDTVPELVSTLPDMLSAMPDLMAAAPPVLADAMNDRRAPEYRTELLTSARLVPRYEDGETWAVVIEIVNQGQEVVSLHSLRLTLEDARQVPVQAYMVVTATPLAIDECAELRGPLLPGETRRIAQRVYVSNGGLTPVLETTELRIWNGPREAAPEVVLQADQVTVVTEAAASATEE